MIYSSDGRKLTEKFEGLRLSAYLDSGGVPTIGFGHTAGVKLGDTCTQEQADAWLQQDILGASATVNAYVVVSLTQPCFDSLCDFVYNVGSAAFKKSTLLRLLNQGNLRAAAEEFERWDHVNGIVVAGLLRRRLAEKSLFLSGLTNDNIMQPMPNSSNPDPENTTTTIEPSVWSKIVSAIKRIAQP